MKSVCSARDSFWGSLGYWGWGLRETLGLKTQDEVAIKESKWIEGVTLYYLEILIQGVFRIWFCIPVLDWAGKYLCSVWFDSIRNQFTVYSYIQLVEYYADGPIDSPDPNLAENPIEHESLQWTKHTQEGKFSSIKDPRSLSNQSYRFDCVKDISKVTLSLILHSNITRQKMFQEVEFPDVIYFQFWVE